MPDNKDNTFEYIAALQDFNKSVGYLIKAIQASVDKGKDTKTSIADTAEYFKDMAVMAEQLEVVVENTEKTKTNTEKILHVVESMKKERKKGIFEKLSPKDKTKGVMEGIKTITLMAGGILAIGAAFKLVGEVDFASVIALSIALPLIAHTFENMDKSLSPKDAAALSLNMIIMSAGLVGSGMILEYMPELGFKQMISLIGVAVGMSVAMIGLGYVADMLNAKEVKSLFMLAGVMPAIAFGLVLSAEFLKNMPEIPFMSTVESTAAVSVSIGIAGLTLALLNMVKLGPTEAIKGGLSMVVIAGALALSSQILSLGDYSEYPDVEWAKGFGLSMLASIPPVLVFGALAATGFGAIVIGAGILSMLAVAGGLVAASHILAEGNYSKYPTEEWSAGVGSGLAAFANTITKIAPGPLDLLFGDSMDQRIESIVKIGEALRDVSFVIQGGSYTGGPSAKWSSGVGMALYYFSSALENISPNFLERWVFGDSTDQQIESMVKLGGALYQIGVAVGKDNSVYQGGPKKEWAEGVGLAISHFASALDSAEGGFVSMLKGESTDQRIALMVKLAKALPMIGIAVGKDSSLYQGGPSEKWAKGVGGAVLSFSQAIATINDEIDLEDISTAIAVMMPLAPLIKYFGMTLSSGTYTNYPDKRWSEGVGSFLKTFSELEIMEKPIETTSGIMELSKAYIKLAASLTVLGGAAKGLTDLPDMTSLYGGLVTLSLVDEERLDATLDVINDKQTEFSNLFSMIKASSAVKIDESTFAFNKDKKAPEKVTPKSTVKSGTTAHTIPSVAVKTTTTAKPVVTKQEQLLEQVIKLLGQINSGLNEVADNTAKSLSDNGSSIVN